uniref:TRASH domain-containing protein n=1 Tax=Cacopsylla melanoneura TaxID=428564 RepID=A0A8D8VFY0_9HEMI
MDNNDATETQSPDSDNTGTTNSAEEITVNSVVEQGVKQSIVDSAQNSKDGEATPSQESNVIEKDNLVENEEGALNLEETQALTGVDTCVDSSTESNINHNQSETNVAIETEASNANVNSNNENTESLPSQTRCESSEEKKLTEEEEVPNVEENTPEEPSENVETLEENRQDKEYDVEELTLDDANTVSSQDEYNDESKEASQEVVSDEEVNEKEIPTGSKKGPSANSDKEKDSEVEIKSDNSKDASQEDVLDKEDGKKETSTSSEIEITTSSKEEKDVETNVDEVDDTAKRKEEKEKKNEQEKSAVLSEETQESEELSTEPEQTDNETKTVATEDSNKGGENISKTDGLKEKKEIVGESKPIENPKEKELPEEATPFEKSEETSKSVENLKEKELPEETTPLEKSEEKDLEETSNSVENLKENELPEETTPLEQSEEKDLEETSKSVENLKEKELPEKTKPLEQSEETDINETSKPIETSDEKEIPEETTPEEKSEENKVEENSETIESPDEQEEADKSKETLEPVEETVEQDEEKVAEKVIKITPEATENIVEDSCEGESQKEAASESDKTPNIVENSSEEDSQKKAATDAAASQSEANTPSRKKSTEDIKPLIKEVKKEVDTKEKANLLGQLSLMANRRRESVQEEASTYENLIDVIDTNERIIDKDQEDLRQEIIKRVQQTKEVGTKKKPANSGAAAGDDDICIIDDDSDEVKESKPAGKISIKSVESLKQVSTESAKEKKTKPGPASVKAYPSAKKKTGAPPPTKGGSDVQPCAQCKKRQHCKFKLVDTSGSKTKTNMSFLHFCTEACVFKYQGIGVKKPVPAGVKVPPASPSSDSSSSLCMVAAQWSQSTGGNGSTLSRSCTWCSAPLSDDVNAEILSWETFEFCKVNCLQLFQRKIGALCSQCTQPVPVESLGKYCVRFGCNVNQFCVKTCLDGFKQNHRPCFYCQTNMSANRTLYRVEKKVLNSMSSGNKMSGSTMITVNTERSDNYFDFCDSACVRHYQEKFKVKYRVRDRCAVCRTLRPVQYQVRLSLIQSQV